MRSATLVGIVLVVASCQGGPGKPHPSFDHMQLFPSPRDFDAPGTIFRIDGKGEFYRVIDLSAMLQITPRDEAIPTITLRDRFRGRLLGKSARDSAFLSDSTRDSIVIAAKNAKRELTTEVQLTPVIDSALKVLRWRSDSRYYLISETILADSVTYIFSSSSVVDLGGEGRLTRFVRGSATLSWSREGPNYHLAERFPKPLRVFYKVQRLTPRGAALGGGVLRVDRQPETNRIFWTVERSSP